MEGPILSGREVASRRREVLLGESEWRCRRAAVLRPDSLLLGATE